MCADADCHDNLCMSVVILIEIYFLTDGVKRIYADNQIGYRNESPHLKNFLMDGEYDYFGNYEDGIYEITSQEYQDFFSWKEYINDFQ